jgi:hypothetical protein
MVVLVLLKSVGFAKYARFGVFGLHGHFDLIFFFFRDLEVTYPPIFKCSEQDGAKKFP